VELWLWTRSRDCEKGRTEAFEGDGWERSPMAGTQSNWDAVEGVAALVFDGASPTLNGGVSVVTVSLR